MQRALLLARSECACRGGPPSLLSLYTARSFASSIPPGSSDTPPSAGKQDAGSASKGQQPSPSAAPDESTHRSQPSSNSANTQHSLDHARHALDGRSKVATSNEKLSGLPQRSQQEGASTDPLAVSLHALIQSAQARVSSTQAKANQTLADVQRRVRSTLAETSTSLAARREGLQQQYVQQPFSSRLYARLQGLSAAVNQLTGYTTVEHLKAAVAQADENLARLRKVMEQKKQAHESMLDTQLNLQRDLNALLQKKSSWVDQDVSRFTELCRMEHKTENSVAAAREAFEAAADEVEAAQADLFKAIRERYTEEQLWGDKIRRTATWWTWGLMGLQMLSFMGVIFYIEPRRVRILQGHLNESLDQHEASMQEHLNSQLDSHFAQMCQAVHDSREINVVLHSLDEMQQMGMMGMGAPSDGESQGSGQPVQHVHLAQGAGGGGLNRNRVGDEKGEELAKVLSAVVSFMDGVNTELGVMRDQLGRLEAAGRKAPSSHQAGAPVLAMPGAAGAAVMQGAAGADAESVQGAPVFAMPGAVGMQGFAGADAEGVQGMQGVQGVQAGGAFAEGVHMKGVQGYTGSVVGGAPQALHTGSLERTQSDGGAQGRTEGVGEAKASESQRRSAQGLDKWLRWGGRPLEQWSPEQAAGVAAAVGSGVGAVVGALLVTFFSSR